MNVFISIMMITIIFVAIIVTFGKKRKEIIFDEMQLKIRNKGYRYSFLTLLLFNSIYSFLESGLNIKIFDSFTTASFVGLLISIFVFSFICIREDAYLGIKDNFRRKATLFLILGISNISTSILDFMEGNWVVDGLLTFSICCPLLSLMMIVLGVFLVFKVRKEESKIEEEE